MKTEFNYEDLNLSKKDFELAVKGLIDKGLLEEVLIEGQIKYRLTKIGMIVGGHLDSDPKFQN